ncbi:DUF2752 domain-containing protein [Pseudoxanthomonas sangjuensis]|uniref:DUF2752 domain-containing protein n=1 Tax=Pseudoxanthomonas sangjuensis TaxID=1503750 RepID=UPI003CCCE29E
MNAALKPLQIAGLAAAAFAAVAGFWLLRNFDPNAAGSIFPPCAFRELTGFYCVGCGATRMLHALVHLDVPRAFSMNPLAMLLLSVSPLLAAWKLGWRATAMQPVIALLSQPRFWLVLLPAYWIARNLPWFPFTLLAPG